MNHFSGKKGLLILVLALVIWTVCGAVMFAGMAFLSLNAALVVHALAAPLIAAVVAWFYFKHFHYTAPLATAVIFTAIVILMDLFVVALMIQKSFDMFTDPLGTWIPFALIFTATYLVGRRVGKMEVVVTDVS